MRFIFAFFVIGMLAWGIVSCHELDRRGYTPHALVR